MHINFRARRGQVCTTGHFGPSQQALLRSARDLQTKDFQNRERIAEGELGMQERATLAGGSVVIESNPGAGTTVFVRIPLGGRD